MYIYTYMVLLDTYCNPLNVRGWGQQPGHGPSSRSQHNRIGRLFQFSIVRIDQWVEVGLIEMKWCHAVMMILPWYKLLRVYCWGSVFPWCINPVGKLIYKRKHHLQYYSMLRSYLFVVNMGSLYKNSSPKDEDTFFNWMSTSSPIYNSSDFNLVGYLLNGHAIKY